MLKNMVAVKRNKTKDLESNLTKMACLLKNAEYHGNLQYTIGPGAL